MPAPYTESRIGYLYEAVRCGTVRAAADFLDIAPSAVSRQIALLEEELATPLVERNKRGVKPTEAGALLLEYFSQQRAHQADLVSKIQELRGLRRGKVTVVMGEGFASTMVGGPIRQFRESHPEISLTVDQCSTNEVVRRVAEDEADIGLAFNPSPDPKVVSRAESRQPMHAVVAPDFPLAGKLGSVTLQDLLPYPLALTHPEHGTRRLVEAAMLLDRVRLTPALTTNSVTLLKLFITNNLGFTFLTRIAVAPELEAGQLTTIPVENRLLQSPEAQLITRVGRQLSPAANRLLQRLATQIRQYDAAV
ncbi:LysR family transcriptional regulator [Cupriavidus sp. AcVe19-6a]|uniref:LysR family transcriptional regulator n=1 Tax=Cupriavidus sp. AcVe19-6a TaxID=2821358 RepID=UPI001AE7BA6F|nr:LysR family transcriptional regulator [Cupriavidus sp. AcVe19-6a]MBP0639099.1 LysR family transcriptional regulator [Cupriavidus sp. AcVe19-6a]